MGKFIVVGIVQVETIVQVDAIPVVYTPITSKPNTIFTDIGGDAYNECLALKALGNEVTFMSMVGKDAQMDIVNLYDMCMGIDTGFVLNVLDSTPTAVVLYDKERQQQIFEDIKNLRDFEYDMSIFEKEAKTADMVVLANAKFCQPLARKAKELGKTLAVNFRGFSEDKIHYNEEMLSLADIIYISDDNLVDSSYDFVRSLADKYDPEVIILGQGAKGLIIYVKKTEALVHYNTVKTNEVINTVGAGEALFSCFLHFYMMNKDAKHAIRNALLFASYKIGFTGSSKGFMTEEELEHWHNLIWGEMKIE
ncbi:MAG TPA: carbohydrate kinase family protein [Lachnospiraceae bacterium]|nr:carbohydrate kinase family protein [Lachnospiraceae bacterium]